MDSISTCAHAVKLSIALWAQWEGVRSLIMNTLVGISYPNLNFPLDFSDEIGDIKSDFAFSSYFGCKCHFELFEQFRMCNG